MSQVYGLNKLVDKQIPNKSSYRCLDNNEVYEIIRPLVTAHVIHGTNRFYHNREWEDYMQDVGVWLGQYLPKGDDKKSKLSTYIINHCNGALKSSYRKGKYEFIRYPESGDKEDKVFKVSYNIEHINNLEGDEYED